VRRRDYPPPHSVPKPNLLYGRQVVVVAREVRGRTRPFVVSRESEAVPLIEIRIAPHLDFSTICIAIRMLGAHYHELAEWLRLIARSCRLPYTRLELTRLARRYDLRADQLQKGLR
jgi:hypothetical protein